MQQYGWPSKWLCWMKEVRFKKSTYCIIPFTKNKHPLWQKAGHLLFGGWEGKKGPEWGVRKCQKKIRDNKYVCYVACDYGFMNVCKCQNLSYDIL